MPTQIVSHIYSTEFGMPSVPYMRYTFIFIILSIQINKSMAVVFSGWKNLKYELLKRHYLYIIDIDLHKNSYLHCQSKVWWESELWTVNFKAKLSKIFVHHTYISDLLNSPEMKYGCIWYLCWSKNRKLSFSQTPYQFFNHLNRLFQLPCNHF